MSHENGRTGRDAGGRRDGHSDGKPADVIDLERFRRRRRAAEQPRPRVPRPMHDGDGGPSAA
jgi:hypothetical protein